MATTIIYKNQCTPQEYLSEGGRWYLDDDVKKKLSGVASINLDTITYKKDVTLNLAAVPHVILGTELKFLYIKNYPTSDNNVKISTFAFGDANYRMILKPGQSFVGELVPTLNDGTNNVPYISSEGISMGEYITGS